MYACDGKFIGIEGAEIEKNIVDVIGDLSPGKTRNAVLGLAMINTIATPDLPTGIASFLPNLEAFWAENCGIEKVKKQDFEGFKNLKQVHFYGHKIQSVDSDLFSSNPLLQHISLSGNPLKHVGLNVFENLTNLKSLAVIRNTCIDSSAEDDQNEIENLKFKILVKCPPSFATVQKAIVNSAALKLEVEKQVAEKLSPLSWKLFEFEQKLASLE